MNSETFNGFSRTTTTFFDGLRENNRKEWFEENRRIFDEKVMREARLFVLAMGERLRTIAPETAAIPAVDKSIFRLHRDTRFSPDKSPYKTHLGVLFWEGPRTKLENSGFYFHLEPPRLSLGAGLYQFPPDLRDLFREWASDEKQGADLAATVRQLKETGKDFTIGGSHYKRIPAGFDPGCLNAELLKHNGLYAMWDGPIPDALYSAELIDFCMEIYRPMLPLHNWLLAMTRASV